MQKIGDTNMIKISIKLDKRRRLKNGKFPLKYKIARKDAALYIATGIDLKETDWDEKLQKIKNLPEKTTLNLRLNKKLNNITDKIESLREEGKLRFYSNKNLLLYLSNELDENKRNTHLFSTQLQDFLDTKDNAGTKKMYLSTVVKMKEYCDYDNLLIDDIDIDWLESFVRKLRKDANKVNTIAMRLRHIRTIINHARRHGVIKDYVFSMYRIETEETVKRSLTVEQLRILYNAELSKSASKHRDIFFLVFFLMGINMADLSRIENIDNGRIKYRRAKTGTLYDIKVEPEAQCIIDKYRGKKKLLKVFDKVIYYNYYVRAINDVLAKICKELSLPKVTVYWARHTFATIAYQIGVPIDVIADCLGHKSAHKITEIYIAKDQNKIDEANRKVIDFVLYNKREG